MTLAIDIGTTFLKVAVIDFNGKIYFSEKRVIGLSTDKDSKEVDPVKWSKGLTYLFGSVPTNILSGVTSVVVSGNGPTIVPIDNLGVPVGKAILWGDDRALHLVDEIKEKTGEFLPANFFLSKAYWYKAEAKDKYDSISSFLSCPEYISFLLTGNLYTTLPSDGFKDYYWSEDKIEKLSLDSSKFPPFISPFSVYGELKKNVISGIHKSIPVICGGPDFIMSILGTGSIYSGILCDRTGTSEGLNYCASKEINLDGFRTLPHIVNGLYTVAGLIPESGEYVLSDRVDTLISKYRAVIAQFIDAGLNIDEIRVVGGHAGIEKINRLKAESFPIPLKIYGEGSDLVGNAVLGSVVTGFYKDIEEACSKMVKESICYN